MARRPTTSSNARSSGSDDVFLEKTLAFGAWAAKNRQALIGLGIAALVVALGSIYYWNYRRTHLQQAAVELERVEQHMRDRLLVAEAVDRNHVVVGLRARGDGAGDQRGTDGGGEHSLLHHWLWLHGDDESGRCLPALSLAALMPGRHSRSVVL